LPVKKRGFMNREKLDLEKVYTLYKQGVTISNLAIRFNCSYSKITAAIKKYENIRRGNV